MMNRFTIKSRLFITFGLLLVFAAGLGLFSLQRISGMKQVSDALAKDIDSVAQLGEMVQLSQELNTLAMTRHFVEDEAAKSRLDAEIAEAHLAFSKSWSDFAPTIATAEEDALAVKVFESWQHFLAVEEEVNVLRNSGFRELAQTVLLRDLNENAASFSLAANDVRDFRKQEAELRAERAERVSQNSVFSVMLAIALIVPVGICLIWLIVRSVSTPITRMTDVMKALADQKMDTEVPGAERHDEIGSMAAAVLVFKENMIAASRLRHEQEELARKSAEERRSQMLELADQFEGAVGQVIDMVASAASELQASVGTMTAASEETNAQCSAVASAAEQAASNVQAVAAAIEELSASAAEIGRRVDHSTSVADRAVDEAQQTNSRMSGLQSDAEKIGTIIGLIDDVAAQTNLLALNATIEAARAGEAGKGFAVVAQEVKGLAEQTARATAEISAQIKSMQSSSSDAAEAINGIGTTIGEMNSISQTITEAMEEQNQTTSEVSQNVHQASIGTREVTSNIEGVAEAARESAAASSQVLSASNELAQQAETLRLEMRKFLETVRAA